MPSVVGGQGRAWTSGRSPRQGVRPHCWRAHTCSGVLTTCGQGPPAEITSPPPSVVQTNHLSDQSEGSCWTAWPPHEPLRPDEPHSTPCGLPLQASEVRESRLSLTDPVGLRMEPWPEAWNAARKWTSLDP